MNKFKCFSCGHIVHSEADEVYPINWSDGHVCDFVKQPDIDKSVHSFYNKVKQEKKHGKT